MKQEFIKFSGQFWAQAFSRSVSHHSTYTRQGRCLKESGIPSDSTAVRRSVRIACPTEARPRLSQLLSSLQLPSPLHMLFSSTLSTLELQLQMLLPIHPIAKVYHVSWVHVSRPTEKNLHFLLGLPRERAQETGTIQLKSLSELTTSELTQKRELIWFQKVIIFIEQKLCLEERRACNLSSRLWIYQSIIAKTRVLKLFAN